MEPKRLNKFISDTGFCSRREADRLIEEERVTVNGKLPEPGIKVTPKDKVRIDDQILQVRDEAPVYLVLNKPSGMSATADMGVRDNVVRAINHPASLLPIGKLDREDEGILFLSNDSDFVRKLSKSDTRLEKELIVTLDKPISNELISKLSEACASFEDGMPKKANIKKESTTRFRVVLEPGMNHSIKKTCIALGYQVTFMQRVRVQNINLTKLQKGHWRTLSAQELEGLKLIASSKAPLQHTPSEGRSNSSRTGKSSSKSGSGANKTEFSGPGKRVGKSRPKTSGAPKAGNSRNTTKGKPLGGTNKGGARRGGNTSRSR